MFLALLDLCLFGVMSSTKFLLAVGSGGDKALSGPSLPYFFVVSFLLPFFSLNLEMLSLARLAEFFAFFDVVFTVVTLEVATVWEISPVIVLEFRLFKLELYCLCNLFSPLIF